MLKPPGMVALVRRFWPLVWKERLIVGMSFVALLAEIGLRLLEPWPLKIVFDRLIPIGAPDVSSVPIAGTLSASALLALAALSLVDAHRAAGVCCLCVRRWDSRSPATGC